MRRNSGPRGKFFSRDGTPCRHATCDTGQGRAARKNRKIASAGLDRYSYLCRITAID